MCRLFRVSTGNQEICKGCLFMKYPTCNKMLFFHLQWDMALGMKYEQQPDLDMA